MDDDSGRVQRVSAQAYYAAAIKHSPLLGDYLDLVIQDKYRLFVPNLTKTVWNYSIDECYARDPKMRVWSDLTVIRLRSIVHSMLAQTGYVDDTRSLRFQPVYISPALISYLEEQREHYVLQCLTVRP